jgi:glycerol-3-phosphate dehydrogenase
VVGCAVAYALARRGIAALLLEAEPGLALGASGANSGILHTGFDSPPGELETRLILRARALREQLMDELGVSSWRCGARLRPEGEAEHAAVARLAANALLNGVECRLEADGSQCVPGETVTDPVAFVHALAGAAQAGGASVRLNAPVMGLAPGPGGGLLLTLAGGERVSALAAVNCAGLFADEIAALAGDRPVEIYPRKGEFLVFAPPPQAPLREILLPVPSELGKGVLVFPTLDGHVIAGPTARERSDKRDWSVESDAAEQILAKARRMWPALTGVEPVGAYAGLRPAGRAGNYVIEPSRSLPGLIHAAAIRSTGMSASLAIGEHVLELLATAGAIERGSRERRLPAPASPGPRAWWERAAEHHAAA